MKNFFKNPFRMLFPKRVVGIDVGTSSIKMVELSRWGEGKTLENYAEIRSNDIYKAPAAYASNGSNILSTDVVSLGIKAMISEARIKTKAAVFSIPDFSTFCTSFDIPLMPEKEIPQAIYYNASQYITLPISEVTLDWKIVSNYAGGNNQFLKVFLVAVPNQVIQEYQTIAKNAGLEIYALEAEALSLARSLVKHKKTTCIIDIGVQSSTINIVDNGFLRSSYGFNFYSGQLSKAVSSALGVDISQAEDIKTKEGLISSRRGLPETLYSLIDPLIIEVKSVMSSFSQSEGRNVEEIYLTGGTANLPGLREYFNESLKKPVVVPNCFSNFLFPPILDGTLQEMSPSFSVAVGVALSGLET